MTDSMIEWVARKIFDDEWDSSGAEAVCPGGRDDNYFPAKYLRHATSALQAMREPTEAMHDAARDWSQAKYGKPIGSDASLGCWQAMLDAAFSSVTGDQGHADDR